MIRTKRGILSVCLMVLGVVFLIAGGTFSAAWIAILGFLMLGTGAVIFYTELDS